VNLDGIMKGRQHTFLHLPEAFSIGWSELWIGLPKPLKPS
jgi:hypothetical protein